VRGSKSLKWLIHGMPGVRQRRTRRKEIGMRPDEKGRRISRSALRLVVLAAVAITAAVGVPLAASASTHSSDGPHARNAAAVGVVYGGRTSQGWPVVIELNRNRRRVVQAVTGLRLNCTSGLVVNLTDRYINGTVNNRRRFGGRFGPETRRNADGTSTDLEGSMSGALNRARSRASGRWRVKLTDYDAAGAVTDTCDSGSVRWTAKQ
jgi:hypothetical protein